ncbi:hypothetical protein EXIGLDRAFT_694401 [Exidia glandulosa HHB12029]|uniref:Uncharacterized protein n=1 Tax=Exidia glandulosa HHB12029 TaxID=1314781 RepID=A0A165GN16_EXIGL|nr:hypothetical protein EXIGLDRAFT_694401 [Exidia glandulosa HHB12029]
MEDPISSYGHAAADRTAGRRGGGGGGGGDDRRGGGDDGFSSYANLHSADDAVTCSNCGAKIPRDELAKHTSRVCKSYRDQVVKQRGAFDPAQGDYFGLFENVGKYRKPTLAGKQTHHRGYEKQLTKAPVDPTTVTRAKKMTGGNWWVTYQTVSFGTFLPPTEFNFG